MTENSGNQTNLQSAKKRSHMKLVINGETREFASALTISALLTALGMKSDRVAVEVNRELVPRSRWSTTELSDGDTLEIVHFVGGGL